MMNLCICTGSGSSLLDNGTKISCAGTNNYLYLSSLMKFITLVFEDNYKEIIRRACADPEGGAGVRTPPPLTLENYKNIGSLAILVWIPLKSQSYQASIQCWAIIGPPVKRRPLIMVFGSFLPSSN